MSLLALGLTPEAECQKQLVTSTNVSLPPKGGEVRRCASGSPHPPNSHQCRALEIPGQGISLCATSVQIRYFPPRALLETDLSILLLPLLAALAPPGAAGARRPLVLRRSSRSTKRRSLLKSSTVSEVGVQATLALWRHCPRLGCIER